MKYTVEVVESPVCYAHQLTLPYESRCNNLHGHNATVAVVIEAEELNPHGMVVDFVHIKDAIKIYDHAYLGIPADGTQPSKVRPEVTPSTAEVFATVLFANLTRVIATLNTKAVVKSVSVWETPSSKVTVTA